MAETDSDGAAVAAAEQSLPEKARGDEVEPGKVPRDSNGTSRRDESDGLDESRISGAQAEAEVEAEEAKRETLAKDQSDGAIETESVQEKSAAAESNGEVELKEKAEERCKEVATSVIPQVDEAAVENQVESSPLPALFSDPSTASAAEGPLPGTSPVAQEQRSLSQLVSCKTVSPVVKMPTHDGYNWRKYGQKQVKSPKGSRSYYRCTYSDCCAKKIECSDDSGDVIRVVNKGSHSHDPPRKNHPMRESRVVSAIAPVSVDSPAVVEPTKLLRDSDPSTSTKENIHEPHTVVERKRFNSSVSEGNGESEAKENHVEEPVPKRRLKKDDSSCPDSVSKPGKKHKYVVHAAGDVGISGDGYRWRKYGQKMVKGNPNPRNYYRCTSAGCPVRKHIETAGDNSTAVIITYKGAHDHDMPVPKKRHGPPSTPFVAGATPTSVNRSQTSAGEHAQSQITSSQCSVGRESDVTGEAMDIGGEKAMESARTLLSIGFEIKQC